MKILLSLFVLLLAIGCSDDDQLNRVKENSSEPAKGLSSLDEADVMEIAKREIEKRESWAKESVYETTRDGQQWNGTVWRLPKTPGGSRYITIDDSGNVTDYSKGK